MADWSGGTCPRSGACDFYRSVSASPILRIKYATMYPYCKGGKHASCMRWFLMESGRAVPDDLLPDGGKDVFAAEARHVAPTAGVRVLVVDDMPLFRQSLVTMVNRACRGECEVITTESAEAALDMLNGSPSGWKLVVTDYNMGKMNGYELIVAMRSNPALVGVPAVVFSSETDPTIRARASELSRVRWLLKQPNQEPFDLAWQELVVQRMA